MSNDLPAVLVIEDHPLVGQGIAAELEKRARVRVVTSLEQATRHLSEDFVDVLILDLWMPDGDGLEWYQALTQPKPAILISGQINVAEIQRASQLGVRHVVSKAAAGQELKACLESVLHGGESYYSNDLLTLVDALEQGEQLSENAIEVLRALQRGLANKQIAELLGISEATVSFHLGQLKKRLNARTNRELVYKASRLDLGD